MDSPPTELHFTVDAELLRELGERLVGRPHIALAELIKNSYDADAKNVILKFDNESIEVIDDGHGMSLDEFRNFWMRIGSPHKQAQSYSRLLRRPLTGSKGVGRLAVQFLGKRVDVVTVSERSPRTELSAAVDWDEAVTAGDLTSATARYWETSPTRAFANGAAHGTSILVRNLRHAWLPITVAEVAREIRDLEPPFRPNPRIESAAQSTFHVDLVTNDELAVSAFNAELRAYLDIWYARIVGRLRSNTGAAPAVVDLTVEFADGTRTKVEYDIGSASLHAVEFEIRVYYLVNRQGRGVRVESARQYIRRFGGVHIYDSGFHLPYYGAETDWLDIERDHSHRLSVSKLLPQALQVKQGLTFLPTQARLFGVVHVDTAFERETATLAKVESSNTLSIQVTRDRLVANEAFRTLQRTVRWALDYYAMLEARRAFDAADAKRSALPSESGDLDQGKVLARYREAIPPAIYSKLRGELSAVDRQARAAEEVARQRAGLLAALATAGMTAIAFDHELGKQLIALGDYVSAIDNLVRTAKPTVKALSELAESLREWEKRARATRALFANIADEDNRLVTTRLKVKAVLSDVCKQLRPLLRGIEVDLSSVSSSMLLPTGTYAEWSALFQNVIINAINALMDSKNRRISVVTAISGKTRTVVVEDTGKGIDIDSSERLFEPFERGEKITPQRRGLGLGGTGLGLTIARMIATNRGAAVKFLAPKKPFMAALELRWNESE
jgi:signal transduction histidine kinase